MFLFHASVFAWVIGAWRGLIYGPEVVDPASDADSEGESEDTICIHPEEEVVEASEAHVETNDEGMSEEESIPDHED